MASKVNTPIDKVPFDVLSEVFLHCLPEDLHSEIQPSVKVAPMLLCHVCSSWRRVALTSAALWTHLSCRITVIVADDDGEIPEDKDKAPWALLKAEIEFIKWWKSNHRSIPPYLCFGVETTYMSRFDMTQTDLVSGDSELDFIVMYLASAQHLRLDLFWWYRIVQRIEAGDDISFPNLHTIVDSTSIEGLPDFRGHPFQILDRLPQSKITLRHLHLWEPDLSNAPIPMHWCTLTRLLLLDTVISADVWFSLIRVVQSLQWGYFNFAECERSYREFDTGPIILSELTTLFLFVDVPFSILFSGVHLPAMHTLYLDGRYRPWNAVIADLSTMFKLAPRIADLSLGRQLLAYASYQYNDTSPNLLTAAATPPWSYVPCLAHLQLEPPPNFRTNSFIQHLIGADSDKNKHLEQTACPIRTITLNKNYNYEQQFDDVPFVYDLPDTEMMTKLNLQIVSYGATSAAWNIESEYANWYLGK